MLSRFSSAQRRDSFIRVLIQLRDHFIAILAAVRIRPPATDVLLAVEVVFGVQ